jgi:uncharacterized protein YeeX (DUF496 family)
MANKTNEYRKRRLEDMKAYISALEKHVRDLESRLSLAHQDVHYYKEQLSNAEIKLNPKKSTSPYTIRNPDKN